jgi:hypothetical protein
LEFLRRFFRRFDRRRPISADSDKTYGNPAPGTACRKTCEFLGRAEASLMGGLMVFPENGWDYETTARVIPQLFCAVR